MMTRKLHAIAEQVIMVYLIQILKVEGPNVDTVMEDFNSNPIFYTLTVIVCN